MRRKLPGFGKRKRQDTIRGRAGHDQPIVTGVLSTVGPGGHDLAVRREGNRGRSEADQTVSNPSGLAQVEGK